MPRNGSGVYSLPSGSTVTNGDPSDSADLNTPFGDLVTDANAARPIVAGGTGATSAAAARTALGLAIGTDVQAYDANLDGVTSDVQTQLDAKAPLASPALTGTPTAPTAAGGTSTTQVATTEFVSDLFTAGAWTPALQDGAGNPPDTVTVASGNYIQIGKLLHYSFRLSINKGAQASTTQLRIEGLPATVTGSDRVESFSPLKYFGFTPTDTPMIESGRDGTDPIILLLQSGNSTTSNYYTFSTLPSGSIILEGSGFMEVD